MGRMRVIVADDQPEVCSALRLLLEEKPGLIVIGEVHTLTELVGQVKASCPDLVLLDWELPGLKTVDLFSLLTSLCPLLSVIVLSSQPQVRQLAIHAGAKDFICKSDPPELLLRSLENFRT